MVCEEQLIEGRRSFSNLEVPPGPDWRSALAATARAQPATSISTGLPSVRQEVVRFQRWRAQFDVPLPVFTGRSGI